MSRFATISAVILCIAFQASAPAGVVVRTIYDGFNDHSSRLRSHATYYDKTMRKELFTAWLGTSNLTAVGLGEVYGSSTRGYLEVPQTGFYTFQLRADDDAVMELSEDHTRNTVPIVQAGYLMPGVSEPVHLERGRKYFFELLHHEGIGGDILEVGWTMPDGTFENFVPERYLWPFPIDELNNTELTTALKIIDGRYHTGLVSGQPKSSTVAENTPAQFTVTAEAVQPATVQWRRNGIPIPGENLLSFKIPFASATNHNDNYDVVITSKNQSITSTVAVLTVTAETIAPFLVKAVTLGNTNGVDLTFSERIHVAAGTNILNYAIEDSAGNAIPVSDAVMLDDQTIRLTAALPPNMGFKVTYQGIYDRAATPNLQAPNPNFQFFAHTSGRLMRKLFIGSTNTTIASLTSDPKFPNSPDQVGFVLWAETPINVMDNYGVQLVGLLTAPATGNYQFLMSSDDQGAVYLSTDENPGNKRVIATEPTWNNYREYVTGANQAGRGTPPANISALIPLEAGKKYYFEALMKEGGGGDNLSVAWEIPGGPTVTNGAPPILANFISAIDDVVGPVQILAEPEDQMADEGGGATFQVQATGHGNLNYQWIRNGQVIEGATETSYTVFPVNAEDHGAKYSVRIENSFSAAISREAVLKINGVVDTPPKLSIVREGNQVVVSWAPPSQGFLLEESPVMHPNFWTPVAGATNPLRVTLPATGNKFYRLRR